MPPDISLVPVDHNPFEVVPGNMGGAAASAPAQSPGYGDVGAVFGTNTPQEQADIPPNILDKLVASVIGSLKTLPRRAIQGAAQYQPGSGEIPDATIAPALEAAMLPMGTGAIAGVPVRAGEAVLGAGPIRAYHGSPHDFDQFSMDKIGTGEGAQAYGHGLYFAESPGVAQSYKEALSKYSPQIDGVPIIEAYSDGSLARRIEKLTGLPRGDSVEASHAMADSVRTGRPLSDILSEKAIRGAELYGPEESTRVAKLGEALAPIAPKTQPGRMYEVNINADPEHFLDWDKPLSEQHPKVQEALNKVGGQATTQLPDGVLQGKNGRYYTMRGDQVLGRYDGWPDASTANEAMRVMKDNAVPNYTFGEWQKKMNVPFPEEKLAQEGIPGIKYLDQGSRPPRSFADTQDSIKYYSDLLAKEPNNQFAADQLKQYQADLAKHETGSRNYVVFDDKLVDILKKYGLAGLSMMPPATAAYLGQKVQQVDHDPFSSGATLTPVDHNPFEKQL